MAVLRYCGIKQRYTRCILPAAAWWPEWPLVTLHTSAAPPPLLSIQSYIQGLSHVCQYLSHLFSCSAQAEAPVAGCLFCWAGWLHWAAICYCHQHHSVFSTATSTVQTIHSIFYIHNEQLSVPRQPLATLMSRSCWSDVGLIVSRLCPPVLIRHRLLQQTPFTLQTRRAAAWWAVGGGATDSDHRTEL